MRSIGKVNIKKLEKIIDEEFRRDPFFNNRGGQALTDAIRERIPEDWFDIWESAYHEIERLIGDGISRRVNGERRPL